MKVLWINGTFGVGKTTTAAHLLVGLEGWRFFDPETVGYLLRGALHDVEVADFQDHPAWRALVPRVLSEIGRETRQHVVAAQTVLDPGYWDELQSGMSGLGIEVFHVVLDCDTDVLRSRIDADVHDTSARHWRMDHVESFASARSWMSARADIVIDTTNLPPDRVAGVLSSLPWLTSGS